MVSNALGWSLQVHGQDTTILLDLLQGLLGDLFADAAAGATPIVRAMCYLRRLSGYPHEFGSYPRLRKQPQPSAPALWPNRSPYTPCCPVDRLLLTRLLALQVGSDTVGE